MKEINSRGGATIVLDIKRLLVLFGGLFLIFGLLFFFGYLAGRRTFKKGNPAASASLSQKKQATSKEFLDPECHIPFSPYSKYLFSDLIGEQPDGPRPTEPQMAQVRRMLPKDTRIYSSSRVDADPPLVFVLHQPQPRVSPKTELTVIKFKRDNTDSEDLGSYCFIPDFLVDRRGRAVAGWAENVTGGNAWGNSSLDTMVIEKGEVSYPEVESDPFQVPKDLALDQGVAVLITLDTRFEFWGGLCHACSPIRQSIFELNRRGVWVDATARHLGLVEEWIEDDLKTLQEAKAGKKESDIGTAALNLYLDAETAKQVARYRKTVKQALNDIGWSRFVEMLDKAARLKCRLIDVPEFNDDPVEMNSDPAKVANAR